MSLRRTAVLDTAELEQLYGRVLQVQDDRRGMNDALGAHFVFSTQRNIEKQASPEGVRWPPLSPRTANRRIGRGRRGYNHMMRVTARLYQSIHHVATEGGVEWGSNVEYAGVHQEGGVIQMPARGGRVLLKRGRRNGSIRSQFARIGTKGAVERQVQIRAHQISIPPRPYLGISEYDRRRAPEIIGEFMDREVNR